MMACWVHVHVQYGQTCRCVNFGWQMLINLLMISIDRGIAIFEKGVFLRLTFL